MIRIYAGGEEGVVGGALEGEVNGLLLIPDEAPHPGELCGVGLEFLGPARGGERGAYARKRGGWRRETRGVRWVRMGGERVGGERSK